MDHDICLVCKSNRKRSDHQFCSHACTERAASQAPALIRVPKGHVMHDNVSKIWKEKWADSSTPCLSISKVYLITWSHSMRASFENYRENVARERNIPSNKPKEIKCFRSERRACYLGDSPNNTKLCSSPDCRLCLAIKTSFKSSLDYKRDRVKEGANDGVRFGGGVYMSRFSNKAWEYAKNIRRSKSSEYHAVLVTRTVLGKIQTLKKEEHTRTEPDEGYDSVRGTADGGNDPECIVYHEDAVRPAYLLLFKA